MWTGCSAESNLRGVGLFESDTFTGLKVSMAGGGMLNIAAKDSKFENIPENNLMSFVTEDFG